MSFTSSRKVMQCSMRASASLVNVEVLMVRFLVLADGMDAIMGER
jgi:hypothetical protein